VKNVDRQDGRPDDSGRLREHRLEQQGEQNRGYAVLLGKSELDAIVPRQLPGQWHADERLSAESRHAEYDAGHDIDSVREEHAKNDGHQHERGSDRAL